MKASRRQASMTLSIRRATSARSDHIDHVGLDCEALWTSARILLDFWRGRTLAACVACGTEPIDLCTSAKEPHREEGNCQPR